MTGNPYVKYSTRKLGDFIMDESIIKFFVEDLEKKLEVYESGSIQMKPDVLKQIKELEVKRKDMEKKMMEERKKNMEPFNGNNANNSKNAGVGAGTGSAIVFREEGKPPRELNHHEVVETMMAQQKQLSQMGQLKELYGNTMRENIRLKEIIETQQKILDEKNVYIAELETKLTENTDIILVDVEKQ